MYGLSAIGHSATTLRRILKAGRGARSCGCFSRHRRRLSVIWAMTGFSKTSSFSSCGEDPKSRSTTFDKTKHAISSVDPSLRPFRRSVQMWGKVYTLRLSGSTAVLTRASSPQNSARLCCRDFLHSNSDSTVHKTCASCIGLRESHAPVECPSPAVRSCAARSSRASQAQAFDSRGSRGVPEALTLHKILATTFGNSMARASAQF